jgi:hypothetical protein
MARDAALDHPADRRRQVAKPGNVTAEPAVCSSVRWDAWEDVAARSIRTLSRHHVEQCGHVLMATSAGSPPPTYQARAFGTHAPVLPA